MARKDKITGCKTMYKLVLAVVLGAISFSSYSKPIEVYTQTKGKICMVTNVGNRIKTTIRHISEVVTSPITGERYCEIMIPKKKFEKSMCFLTEVEVKSTGTCGFRVYDDNYSFLFDANEPLDCRFTCIDL